MRFFYVFLFLIIRFSTFSQTISLYEGKPVFHGAKIVGNHPHTDFLFTVPCTGERPLEFSSPNLPEGFTIEKYSGIIRGKTKDATEYNLTVTAKNNRGESVQNIKIVVGDKLCLTPPMGWNSWNVFTKFIDEKMLMEMADALVKNGMRDIGYQYINIDDYWHAENREVDGRPKADSVKFPHGMKYLADYMHERGLKLGIYSCAGNKTCGKCFGGYNYEEIDAKTYSEWGIDLLKYDYCFAPLSRKAAIERYTKMGNALKNSGRSIVFSVCEWGLRKPWLWAEKAGGSYWRTTPDIFDLWEGGNPFMMSVKKIVNRNIKLSKYAAQGHWNDPDMLLVGNHGNGKATSAGGLYKGMKNIQYHSHFTLWCLMNAPLLASCDLRTINQDDLNILMNTTLTDWNQDILGRQAVLVKKAKGVYHFEKEIEGNKTIYAIFNSTRLDKEVKMVKRHSTNNKPIEVKAFETKIVSVSE